MQKGAGGTISMSALKFFSRKKKKQSPSDVIFFQPRDPDTLSVISGEIES